MVKMANGLYNIFIGKESIFENLQIDEAFSALLTVANYYDGVAYYENQLIARFN